MTLPLTKTLAQTDFEALTEELAVVDQYFTKDREQHPMRRWEYALALRALDTWLDQTRRGKGTAGHVVDVGGAGSPFWRMIGDSAIVVDPADGTGTLAEYLDGDLRLSQAVFCLSVLEHVDDLDQFLYHLSCLVAPGGLLFLTMDCCGCAPRSDHSIAADQHHFHWMRKQIFAAERTARHGAFNWRDVQDWFTLRFGGREVPEFTLLGDSDWTYHGDHVYDYSFASLALVKRA